MSLHAGLDVGGTKCLGIVVDDDGTVVRQERIATPRGADALLDSLAQLATALGTYRTIGVGVPGLVTRSGVLRAAPNLTGVEELDVAGGLGARLGVPVVVDNDATCAAVAEWQVGAGRGVGDMVMVALGTGVGGGIVSGGRVQRGANGFAGEFGHMVVEAAGRPCVCGRRGCWEQYASGSALGRMDPDRSGEELVVAARSGDDRAMALVAEWARWVGIGLANLTNALDPDVIVVGGGVADAPDVLLGPLEEGLRAALYAPEHRPLPVLRIAVLGAEAGAVGAALLGAGR